MKAILIDPARKTVTGIEVDPTKLGDAFFDKSGPSRMIMLAHRVVTARSVLFYNSHGEYNSELGFYIVGYGGIVYGKALLLGRENGRWPVSTTLAVKDIECHVRFSSDSR